MALSIRIEERLQVLNISQAELGRRAGVAQSTINSIIRNDRRSTPHLIAIAQALETTPAYLTGDSGDPTAEFPSVWLSADERRDLELTRLLPKKDRRLIHQMIERLAECAEPSSEGHTIHDRQLEYRAAS